MNAYIWLFLLFGACFGVATFSNRHLFSEGPAKSMTHPADLPWRAAYSGSRCARCFGRSWR